MLRRLAFTFLSALASLATLGPTARAPLAASAPLRAAAGQGARSAETPRGSSTFPRTPMYSGCRKFHLDTVGFKQMKNKSVLALATCLAAAALLWGCARQQQGSSSNAGKRLRLAFVTNNASDFWTIARRGTEKGDQELDNVDVEFRIPSDGTAAEQKRIVDDLLAKGIDGMAISPVDPANQTQMINDAAKRTLAITPDSDAPQRDR